jgi:ribosomal protein S18 acetylase RimI-like enzyme
MANEHAHRAVFLVVAFEVSLMQAIRQPAVSAGAAETRGGNLMSERVTLRPVRPADMAFCKRLYFEGMGWIIEALKLEFAKQHEGFARQWQSDQVRVITVAGEDVGWLQSMPMDDAIFLGQLYLAAGFQRQGIGTEVLRMLIEETEPSGKAITLGVVKINPARRLYERVRFRTTHEDQDKVYMRREPDRHGENVAACITSGKYQKP